MSGPGICVFDIDNTLMRGPSATDATCPGQGTLPFTPKCKGCVDQQDTAADGSRNLYPASYAKGAVRDCLARGFKVAVATAEKCKGGDPDKNYTVESRYGLLEGIGMPKDVIHHGVAGPALMCSNESNNGDKSIMVKDLIKHYKANPRKVVFWDDDKGYREQVAQVPHVVVGKASRSCHGDWCAKGCGISQYDFQEAMNRVPKHHHQQK
eukprot:PhF_6_TR421/c0_g1_i1/m.137